MGVIGTTVLVAPASWLSAALQKASGGQVQLTGARGSVWHGSARLVLSGGQGSTDAVALPGQFSWDIRPLWTGIAIQIKADCCTPQPIALQARATGWSSVRVIVEDHVSQWPASLLTGLGTPWNTVQAQGQLIATTQNLGLEWASQQMALSGLVQLDAVNMSSRLSTLSPMGSYRFTLNGGPSPSLNLSTLDGALQLTGQGQWIAQRLRFSGVATAAPDRVEALSNLLNILGRRDGARSIITVG